MNIGITIMAHPRRKKQALALQRQLRKYPFTEVSITWDQEDDEWDTGSRCLAAGATAPVDWWAIIQDDAILTPDFFVNLLGAIQTVPEPTLISLYVGTVKPMPDRVAEAVRRAYHATWLRANMLFWGVGIILPQSHIAPMLEFLSDPAYSETLYDTRIGMFYQRSRMPIYYTMPSLVDHDDEIGSLLGHGVDSVGRVAHRTAQGVVLWNNHFIDI